MKSYVAASRLAYPGFEVGRMALSIKDFWRLAVRSQVLTARQGQQLQQQFSALPGGEAARSNVKLLAEWLVSQNAISRYQARILLAGRAGPFQYADYQVYDRIGSGRLAGLFRAVHQPTGHPVLIQFLSGAAAGAQWPAAAAHAQALCRLSHDNLVRYYEPVDISTHKFVVLEDLRGRALQERLSAGLPSAAEAAAWARQAALGLAHLHQAGLVHGDVRPANLWLGSGQRVQLLLEAAGEPQAPNLRAADPAGELLGRADYFAPEFAAGQALGEQTDIYTLGCTLYELLCGSPPFAGGDIPQKMQRHASEAIQKLDPQRVPPPLAEVVSYLMAKNPEVRYRRARDVAEQLERFVEPPQPPQPPAAAAAPSLTPYLQHIRQKQAELAAADQPVESLAAAERPPAIDLGGSQRVASPAESDRTRSRRNKPLVLVSALGGAAAVVLIIAAMLSGLGRNGKDPLAAGPDVRPTSGASDAARDASSNDNGVDDNGVDHGDGSPATGPTPSDGQDRPADASAKSAPPTLPDDGQSLWASPTWGDPIQLDYLPMGAVAYLWARPADLLSRPAGQQVLKSLGPHFEQLRSGWQQRSGVALEDVERLLMGLHENGDRFPRPSYVVRLREPRERAELLAAWGNPSAATVGEATYYVGRSDAYYVPPNDGPASLFVMGAPEDVKDVATRGSGPPTVRNAFHDLLAASDAERHFTVVFAPFDLPTRFFPAGRSLYFGDAQKAARPLDWFLGDGLNAVSASAHVDDQRTYLELRFAADLGVDKLELAGQLRQRIGEIPNRMLQHLAANPPSRYWYGFTLKFPGMFRFLHEHARVQLEGDLAVVNAVLPPAAAHNLVFGCELALSDTAGAAAAAPPAKPKGPQNLAELLQSKMSLSFDQLSLEFAIDAVLKDVQERHNLPFPFDIQIVGKDLELNGITRNQQIAGFAERDRPLADVLTALVMKANPVPNVEDPSQNDQKLIWVVAPDPQAPGKQIILITTREAAKAKNYVLPEPFRNSPA